MSENIIRKVLANNLRELFSPFAIDFEKMDDTKLSKVIDFVFGDYRSARELLDHAGEKNERMHRKRLDFIDEI